jgi:hypothetical protein
MKLGTEDRKKLTILGVAGTGGLGAIFYIYSQLSSPGTPPPAAPAIVTAPAQAPTQTSAQNPAQPSALSPSRSSAAPSIQAAQPALGGERAAGRVGVTAAKYDPTLHMEAMLVTEALVYTGSGRNIFSPNSAPAAIAIPKAIAPARPKGPEVPIVTGPPPPPPPPPIDLKFFGTATRANGSRRAFLLHGEDVFLASTGDVVQRRYKIGTISATSVEVEDLTDSNRQTLPLIKF